MIKVTDIAYVRFQAPDLDVMGDFLTDFGLRKARREKEAPYMHGAGGDHAVHITHRGKPAFLGLALKAASEADLEKLAGEYGGAVEPRREPGGGHCLHLRDPDGFAVEVVHGMERRAPVQLPPPLPANRAGSPARLNRRRQGQSGPAHIHRLGHCVLDVTDYRASRAWYQERFGLLISDEIHTGEAALGAFLRCDCGDEPVDHHSLFLLGTGHPGFNHAAFEVADFENLMQGNDHLLSRDTDHVWGIGRHILGGQIFNYWRDPWGHKMEHWTDGDLFDNRVAPGRATVEELVGTIWGPKTPAEMGH